MKVSELQAKGTDDLRKELESLLKAQFSMRMQKATQQLTNTSQMIRIGGKDNGLWSPVKRTTKGRRRTKRSRQSR